MGQAWCKEKTSKAQDSKSPLDRVFVRCAHRIYPGLKEEGSVLGGATQRVTSSEIGYAGSPPREVLARGRSIDSVDRPFHPSEWVDVNLEVPNTPRASPVLTNLTVDTSPYPTDNHPTFADSNLKSTTPIPPPRRRKKNKGRPLPPKPDEVTESSSSNSKRTETNEEPLYSSVKSPKNSGDEQDADEIGKHRCSREIAARDGRRTKEIYEHKVNGTGRIISSDVVSGKRSCRVEEKKTGRMHESNHHRRKTQETDEYERFASSRTSKDSSTPNREDKRALKGETEKGIKDSSSNARPKNYSTVSLPNYDELDMARHRTMEIEEGDEDKTKPRRPVRSSTGSLPAESFLSPFSEKTSVRLEDYIPSQGSPDNLSAYQLLEKLSCGQEDAFVKYESASKSQDWDLGDVGNCESNHQQRRSPFEVISGLNDENIHQDEDVVDFSGDNERKSPADPNVSTCSIYLQKAEALGKATPALGELEYSEVDPNRSAEIRSKPELSDPPTLVDSCKVLLPDNSTSKEPFFLDEEKHRSALDAIGGSCRNDESKTIFTRSLSNESEPNEDTCETKDLRTGLIRSISEESLPKEMLEEQRMDQIFDEKHAKDVHNNLKKNRDEWKTKTPPPSPEAKTKNETMDLDHSTLLKVLKEEAAEESNLSSMTPSLTELEAALSDMLEKEDSQEGLIEESKIIEKSDVPVSLGQILKDRKAAAGRKVSFCSWEEAVAQSASRNDQEFTERPVDLDKRTVSHPNEDPRDSNEDGVVCPMDLPPEKPSRLNRSLDDTVLKTPTPPKRRHRSLQLGKKDALLGQNGSAYSNDRLI